MKLATFAVSTPLGPIHRTGALMGAEDRIVDLSAACAAMYQASGDRRSVERAEFEVPSEMNALLGSSPESLEIARHVLSFVAEQPDGTTGMRGEQLVYRLPEVRLLAPVPHPTVLRDFAGFEDHLRITFGKMGLTIPPSWYDQPIAFKGSVSAMRGPEEVIAWPRYTEKLDYELEICAVIGRGGRDIPPERAREHIAGFTVLNDWSARDVQRAEMAMGTGPFKAKDFAWGLGPWIATTDSLANPSSLRMSVRVNGDVWADVVPEDMYWTFEDMVSYASQDEDLLPGDLLGSGTVTGGCGFEIDRWVKSGDVVELEIEGIGTLRQYVGSKPSEPRVWANRRAARNSG